jgi:hypothetical protein
MEVLQDKREAEAHHILIPFRDAAVEVVDEKNFSFKKF